MRGLKTVIFYIVLISVPVRSIAQICNVDSNYYSIHYTAPNNNYITDGIITPQNELVALCQNTSVNSSYVAKFTTQGNVIWSNEYIPNYPFVNWLSFPWYNQTRMNGILPSSDSTYYIYGSSTEHGREINNTEDPPQHQVGLLLNIDKFGKIIAGKYFGNWRTDYTVNSVIQLADGGLVVYLRSHFSPYTSKVIRMNKDGDIIWGVPLRPTYLYTEYEPVNPTMKQLSNGNIMIMSEMRRSIADTLIYPFLIIILPAPLYLFSFTLVDSKTGQVISQTSLECPGLINSNVSFDFAPQIKSVTELPNGDFSFCADMYWPQDHVVFYQQKVFSKRAVNIFINKYGYYTGVVSYKPPNSACTLQSVWQIGHNGEQVLLVKDSIKNQLILFAIDDKGKVEWTKAYVNPLNIDAAQGVLLHKTSTNGYSIFQSDPSLPNFDLIITNSIGRNACVQLPDLDMVEEKQVWPWPPNKVQWLPASLDIDFRYSPFNFVQKSYPLNQNTYCQYEKACCKDVIDSLHPNNISICEDQTYTLPDNSVVKDSGTYYQTLKTTEGCDSIVFYNLKIIKSPAHLYVTPDTCLKGAATITVTATGGYDSYMWEKVTTADSSYAIYKPGSYSVTVENLCGSKTDTVNVFDECNFPIYFPNAFTPNGDLLNDVLKVPWANKNRLKRLRIYNRFGQLIFSTTKASEGWDGTYRNVDQPTGVYTYILEMEGLSGRQLNQKGTVTLIR